MKMKEAMVEAMQQLQGADPRARDVICLAQMLVAEAATHALLSQCAAPMRQEEPAPPDPNTLAAILGCWDTCTEGDSVHYFMAEGWTRVHVCRNPRVGGHVAVKDADGVGHYIERDRAYLLQWRNPDIEQAFVLDEDDTTDLRLGFGGPSILRKYDAYRVRIEGKKP